jgi:conjugal transfer pilus assembly protein TraK
MYSKFKKWSSLILFALLAISQVNAMQLIENSDKQHVQVNISAKESNRLAIDGRKITSIVPAQPGIIAGKKDESQGVLYFALTADQPAVGTVTLFVTDDQGVTYKLILVPRAIAGEEIIVKPPADKALVTRKTNVGDGRAASYQRRIKDLILVMADEQLQGGPADRVDINKEVSLWQEGRLVIAAKYMETDLVGEKYRLTNISRADMLLAEQELFRHGVRAVSIKNQTLTPGDSTDIFIVRERKDNE